MGLLELNCQAGSRDAAIVSLILWDVEEGVVLVGEADQRESHAEPWRAVPPAEGEADLMPC